jgi:cytochrome d ubiquinol oxidase subunit II
MISTFVVLDGFDFGAGALHLLVAKSDDERRAVFAAIGPIWDGNEVWLVTGGGIFFFAFPKAYAASFSGFYLPLMMVLWLLILRGISIEFRSMEKSPLWRSGWDGVFLFSSTLMTVVLGAALGNMIRGVPVEADGYFSGPLFTNFMPGVHPGVLDWYTTLVGVFTLVMLALHGALFLRLKTDGAVRDRSEAWAKRLWVGMICVGLPMTICTHIVRPEFFETMTARPVAWVFIVVNFGALIAIPLALRAKSEAGPFYASCTLIVSSLACVATGMYPILLRSTVDPAYSLTIDAAASGTQSLQQGLPFWLASMVLAVGYFYVLFRSFRGKVQLAEGGGH